MRTSLLPLQTVICYALLIHRPLWHVCFLVPQPLHVAGKPLTNPQLTSCSNSHGRLQQINAGMLWHPTCW